MTTATAYEGFAIVEQLGHKRIVGYVTEVQMYGTTLMRVDVPDGDKPMIEPLATQFISGGSLYALTPCNEAVARREAMDARPLPVQRWGGRMLSAHDDDLSDVDVEDEDSDAAVVERILDASDGLETLLCLCVGFYREQLAVPEGDRYVAILNHAIEMVRDGAWPLPTPDLAPPPAPADLNPPLAQPIEDEVMF